MPAIFTPAPTEIERKDTGSGGRPPQAPKRTGGGGDGDEWKNRPPGRRGPRELLGRVRWGIFSFLAADTMFFLALISMFVLRQSNGHFDRTGQYLLDWRPVAVPPILWLTTLVLITSSLTAEIARRGMFRETDVMEEWLGLGKPAARRAMPWLFATLALGLLFLAGQWSAWLQVRDQGALVAENPSTQFLYLFTEMHAAHLLIGIVALGGAVLAMRLARRVEVRQVAVDCVVWYWHAMGVLWIVLFALLMWFQ